MQFAQFSCDAGLGTDDNLDEYSRSYLELHVRLVFLLFR